VKAGRATAVAYNELLQQVHMVCIVFFFLPKLPTREKDLSECCGKLNLSLS
jgi:hypothetical protein